MDLSSFGLVYKQVRPAFSGPPLFAYRSWQELTYHV